MPWAVVITAMAGLVYGTVQQVYRQSANDPQIQIAEDLARYLAQGGSPQNAVPAVKIDIAQSLAPFIIVFDDNAQPILSSAILNGKIPVPPAGVFDYVRKYGQDRITWQPRTDVRSAIVVARYTGQNSGFVLAGRSLREIEKRESRLEFFVAAGWLATLIATLFVSILTSFKIRRYWTPEN